MKQVYPLPGVGEFQINYADFPTIIDLNEGEPLAKGVKAVKARKAESIALSNEHGFWEFTTCLPPAWGIYIGNSPLVGANYKTKIILLTPPQEILFLGVLLHGIGHAHNLPQEEDGIKREAEIRLQLFQGESRIEALEHYLAGERRAWDYALDRMGKMRLSEKSRRVLHKDAYGSMLTHLERFVPQVPAKKGKELHARIEEWAAEHLSLSRFDRELITRRLI